jgi:cyanophycin synthetase
LGKAACNIENTLAAVSSLYAFGIPVKRIMEGISGFRPDTSTNPGRFNIFEMGGFSVMLDYGHNIAGYSAAIEMVQSFGASLYTGVIGMPGDRKDESICEVGRLCGRSFSKVYIKEDSDLRDRDAGEVADLLYNAVISQGLDKSSVNVIFQETKALEAAIMDAVPGEMIIMFYEEFEPAVEVIERCRKVLETKSKNKRYRLSVKVNSAG